MLKHLKSASRGHANHGWLDSYHSFSFADFYNPEQMGFSVLRVINEDWIDGGTGFSKHPHRDMEIITYVLEGALEHADTMGNETVIRPGEVQRMSAGSGVFHSEHNFSKTAKTHLLQIWILPATKGIPPSYAQKSFQKQLDEKKFVLLVSKEAEQESISLHQDIKLYAGVFKSADSLKIELESGRKGWFQMIEGNMNVNGESITAGDGLAVSEELTLKVDILNKSHFLFFDLP